MAYVKKGKVSDEYPKHELPKITTPQVRGAGQAGKSNTLDKDGKRRNLEMVNGHKPVEQLESYKQWSKVQGLKRTFIAYYSDCGSLIIACNYANIHPSSVKQWLANDDDFRNDYDVATDMAVAILEHEARRRALAGSDRLLEFLLKSLKPDVYRERYEVKQEIAGDYIIDISNPNQTLITPAIDNTADAILDEPSAL
jgi:hypothetical protein